MTRFRLWMMLAALSAVIGVVATARNADDTHFNEAGVKLLAALVVKSIEPLLKKKP